MKQWIFLIMSGLLMSSAFGSEYRKVNSDNLEIFFREFGQGEPLLIIGGGPGDESRRYLSLCHLLENNLHCILPDQRGTGRSIPDTYNQSTVSLRLTVEDFEAIRSHLGISKWHILGFSYGGYVASYYAHSYPDSISSMVLLDSMGLDTGVFGYFKDTIFSRLLPSDKEKINYWKSPAVLEKKPSHARAEVIKAMIPGYFYDRNKSLQVSEDIRDSDFGMNDIGKFIWPEIIKIGLDSVSPEKRFQGEVLILHGRQDPLGESVALALNSYYESSTLVFIEQCGHYSWVEQPETVKDQIINTIKSH